MTWVRYGRLMINLRQIISVEARTDTKLRFVYPCSNYFSGSWLWFSDESSYTVYVNDANKELDKINELLGVQKDIIASE